MLRNELITLSHRLQHCLNLYAENQHVPLMLPIQHGIYNFLGSNIAGAERYRERIPSLLWRPEEERRMFTPPEIHAIEDGYVGSNEKIEIRFHEMFGPFITERYSADLEQMLDKIINMYTNSKLYPQTWFTCSTVRLRVSMFTPDSTHETEAKRQKVSTDETKTFESTRRNGYITFEIIFIRPRMQRKGILGHILYYMAKNVPHNCNITIQDCFEGSSDAIDKKYGGNDTDIFRKDTHLIRDKPVFTYTMFDKERFLATVFPSPPASYPGLTILNSNILEEEHLRPVWADIAAIAQKYEVNVVQILIQWHFKSDFCFSSDDLRFKCLQSISTMDNYTDLLEPDRSELVRLLEILSQQTVLTKDIYAKDHEKLKLYQQSLDGLETNPFLSFPENMGWGGWDIRFAPVELYGRLLDMLDQLSRIMNKTEIGFFTVEPVSLIQDTPKSFDSLSRDQDSDLSDYLDRSGILAGFRTLRRCRNIQNQCFFQVTSLRAIINEDGRNMTHKIKFTFGQDIESHVTQFKEKIPVVISTLKELRAA